MKNLTLTRRQRWLRGTLLFVMLLFSLVLAAPLMVNVDDYRPDIELQLGAAIDHEVSIDNLSLRTVPGIRLVATGIHINRPGENETSQAKVKQIDIYPNLLPLLDGEVDINNITLKEVLVHQNFIESMSELGDGQQSSSAAAGVDDDFVVSIRNVHAESVNIILDEVTTIGPYRTDISLDDELLPSIIRLARMDGKAQLDMIAVNEGFHLELKAANWALPVGPALQFDKLDAKGLLDDMGIRITAMTAQAYKGELDGMTAIDWAQDWKIEGTLTGKNINSEPLLNVFLDQPVVSGRFTGGFNYKLKARQAADLGNRPAIEGDFMFADGVIYNADLEGATNLLSSDAVKGGETPFSEVSGYLKIKNNAVLVNNLKVKSNVLEAEGKIGIDAKDNLAGVIEVGVTKTGSLVSVPIKVSGSLDEPSLRPTNEAIAGGAVGTGLLGPGVGTAVGIKIGTFFGNLFGDNEEDSTGKPAKPATKQQKPAEDDPWAEFDEYSD